MEVVVVCVRNLKEHSTWACIHFLTRDSDEMMAK